MSRVIVATPSPEFEEQLRAAYGDALSGELRYWRDEIMRAQPSQVVEELANTGADVVAIGPGIHVDSALELARAFDRDRPEVVVVIVAEPTADLWAQAVRAGVRDVVAPTAVGEELRVSFDQALETAGSRQARLTVDETRQPSTRVIAVISPKGGSGKTTVATNLAVGLAQTAPHQVVLIDLDLQFGDVASALRLTPEHTIADTARTGVLDTTTLKVLLTPHPAELFALCAPESLAQADDLDPEHLAQVVRPLSSEFKYIVVDTSAGIDAHALAAMELATDLIMVCTTDVPCVRGVRKAVEALDIIGLNNQTRHFVLNRADARVGLSASDIEGTLGMSIDVSVPSSQAMWLSLNSGTPILESDANSPAGRAMTELVARFNAGAGQAHAGNDGGGRRRRKASR
ncbi:MAG: AAA family ATPase [Actinomycetota bacterium]